MKRQITLASASPRRRELMTLSGIPFVAVSMDVKEIQTGSPKDLVMQNALLKGEAALLQDEDRLVLAADTIVAIEGQILGKPKDEADAERMLRILSGAWQEVYTGVALIDKERRIVANDITRVHFLPLDEGTIKRYVKTGESMDKAGAYALQGMGGMFVDRIEGSASNAIGLPMALARQMLLEIGYCPI